MRLAVGFGLVALSATRRSFAFRRRRKRTCLLPSEGLRRRGSDARYAPCVLFFRSDGEIAAIRTRHQMLLVP